MEHVLRSAFSLARQRPALIFVDILWKAVWLITTLAALLLVGAWFVSEVRSMEWQDTGIQAVNAWVAATLAREFWAAHKAAVAFALSLVMLLSAAGWFVLEAMFRSRLVGIKPAAENTFKVFLVSNLAKCLVLFAAGLILMMVWWVGAPTLAVVIFAAFAFVLTLADTLIRSDALELLGTDLIRVIGLIGILLLFEAMIAAAFMVIVIAGFLNVSRLMDAVAMLGVTAAVIVFLNLLHSYLLLVRFSAVDIMRSRT